MNTTPTDTPTGKTDNTDKIDPEGFLTLINRAIDQSDRNMADIARIAGFPNRTSIYMIRDGKMKLPLGRVPALAKALDIPPRVLFNRALEQYLTKSTVQVILNSILHLTANEVEIIDFIRLISKEKDPKLTPALMEKIEEDLR